MIDLVDSFKNKSVVTCPTLLGLDPELLCQGTDFSKLPALTAGPSGGPLPSLPDVILPPAAAKLKPAVVKEIDPFVEPDMTGALAAAQSPNACGC